MPKKPDGNYINVGIYVPEKIDKWIFKTCKRLKIAKSALIRQIIQEYIDEQKSRTANKEIEFSASEVFLYGFIPKEKLWRLF